METIKRGSKGDSVKKLQQALGLTVDGIFGANTELAVKQFQMKNGLVADGIVGNKTWDKILNTSKPNTGIITNKPIIENYFLKPGQYLTGNYKNEYIILHHTAGGANPYSVVTSWNTDTQGRVATEFCVGGIDCKTGQNTYDGKIIKTFPDGCQAYHIGTSGSSFMNLHSVGIEICSMGNLTKDSKGIYKTYVNSTCQSNQVCTLCQPFRGYTYYHQYSDKQLQSLKQLLLFIANRDNIDLHEGLYKWIKTEGVQKAFEYHDSAYKGLTKGLLSHASIRKDKFDVSPQPHLVDMILSL